MDKYEIYFEDLCKMDIESETIIRNAVIMMQDIVRKKGKEDSRFYTQLALLISLTNSVSSAGTLLRAARITEKDLLDTFDITKYEHRKNGNIKRTANTYITYFKKYIDQKLSEPQIYGGKKFEGTISPSMILHDVISNLLYFPLPLDLQTKLEIIFPEIEDVLINEYKENEQAQKTRTLIKPYK